MSQEKVNQYKEAKKNRKETVKKEKRNAKITKICAIALVLALVAWIGYSVVDSMKGNEEVPVTFSTVAPEEIVNTVEAE